MVAMEPKVLKVITESPEALDIPEVEEKPVLKVESEIPGILEPRATPEEMVELELREAKEMMVGMETKEIVAIQEIPETLAEMEMMVGTICDNGL